MPTQEELDAQQNRTTGTDTERRSQTFVGPGGEREERVFEDGSRVTQNDSSWGGDVKGAIFDISTNTYTPKTDNQQGIDEDSNDRSIDKFQSPDDGIRVVPNGTVGLCINGTPYWIDIFFDDNKKPYAVTEDPAFQINEP